MKDDYVNPLMAYLTARRMSSLGNLASHFKCSVEDIEPVVRKLESERRLRFSSSRCQSGCDSCSGCESKTTLPALTERTILISLERKGQDL